MFLTRLSGEVLRRFKQPVLTAEILIGILLGPTILGRFLPNLFVILFPPDPIQQYMLETVAWLGVFFLLLDTGLEIDFSSAWRQRGPALLIAITDIIIPMIIAFIPSFFLPDQYLVSSEKRVIFSLFMAVVMTISAMPIASRIMHDLKLLKTDLGYLTMSALAVNDIIGWALFTIILGVFTKESFHFGGVSLVLILTIGFSVLALTLGKKISNKIIDFFYRNNIPEPGASFTFACLAGFVFGAITQKVGIHALFGFFIAGVMVGESGRIKEDVRSIISQMVHSLFIPVFFVNIGLKLDFIAEFDLFLVLIITVIGILGRYIGALVGTFLSKIPKANRNLISIAHTPGGMMEIVVAILALEMGLIKEKIFIAIVCSAVFSSIIAGPWMVLALKKRKNIKVSNFICTTRGIISINDISNKIDALKYLVTHASRVCRIPEIEKSYENLIKREENFSTAIGNGIAIPHIRTNLVKEPVLFCAFTQNGLEWNSIDGKSVNIIFFLLSPTNAKDLHIEIISKIARILETKENLTLLQQSISTLEKFQTTLLQLL